MLTPFSSPRLRDRPAPELPPHLQRVRVHQPLQIGRLYGHAARQVVQGGPLRKEGLCSDRGEAGEQRPLLRGTGNDLLCVCRRE